MDFIRTDLAPDHPRRAREILATHPEVRELVGRNPWTAAIVLGVVAFQRAVAFFLRDAGWLWIVVAAYAGGAFANHALFVGNHESAHNLVLERTECSWRVIRLLGLGHSGGLSGVQFAARFSAKARGPSSWSG